MKRWTEKKICSMCGGNGTIADPSGWYTAPLICPCCGGSGVQIVEVREE